MNNVVLRNFSVRRDGLIFILALLFALVLQGAVPFISTPTLGQAVWTTGFAQSFLNHSVFSIYAHNIGAPEPAAIAFGLSGAWLSAVFMKLGLPAPDAYSAMVAIWLAIAFCAACSIARHFSVHPTLAILAALCWLTMPMIWAHSGYSMVSTGIALIPFYFLFSIKIFSWEHNGDRHTSSGLKIWLLLYPVVCIISIFMDGYSFIMFAAGASILGITMFISGDSETKKFLKAFVFPTHFAGLGIAYSLYTFYIGKVGFEGAPIDFFRGWGVDLTFLLIPTQGMHWLPDLIGWSEPRSAGHFFGDASVWMTSFSIPVILGAVWSACNTFRRQRVVIGLLLITLFGFYMSLGPSIKFNSIKPEGTKLGPLMAKEYAIAPTGSAILSKNIPGFKNMRASYRWGALGIFGAWCLVVLAMSSNNNRRIVIVASIFACLVCILNLPDLSKKLKSDSNNRSMFFSLESDFIDGLRKVVHQGERVAFLPWRNDFLVNYVASRLNIVSFNIGGDKNLEQARKYWPKTMQTFPMARVDANFSKNIVLLLARDEADAVILPYIDMLWAAHSWPYPIEFKNELAHTTSQLAKSKFVTVTNHDFYAVVRLAPNFIHLAKESKLEALYNSEQLL
ncbi:hypothetical protein [Desulfobulbus sp.]|uniref:hypothetical protein n=1 Tax=Desulfobulbus sp. TaxID=895 RepID=UPI0027B9B75D|nr:hypothetical protein [Desulfobulbus sp.]